MRFGKMIRIAYEFPVFWSALAGPFTPLGFFYSLIIFVISYMGIYDQA